VLISIGELQKIHGHEVYAWAQKCLVHDEATFKEDPRFPGTDRKIAAKLIYQDLQKKEIWYLV